MSITTIWRMGEDPEGFYMTMRCGPAMDYEPVGFLIPGNSKLVHYFPDKEEFLALVRSHCRLEPVPDGSGYLQMVPAQALGRAFTPEEIQAGAWGASMPPRPATVPRSANVIVSQAGPLDAAMFTMAD